MSLPTEARHTNTQGGGRQMSSPNKQNNTHHTLWLLSTFKSSQFTQQASHKHLFSYFLCRKQASTAPTSKREVWNLTANFKKWLKSHIFKLVHKDYSVLFLLIWMYNSFIYCCISLFFYFILYCSTESVRNVFKNVCQVCYNILNQQ